MRIDYNKLARAVRGIIFPNENHGTTENPNYWKATKVMENYNNGILSWGNMIKVLSKMYPSIESELNINELLID